MIYGQFQISNTLNFLRCVCVTYKYIDTCTTSTISDNDEKQTLRQKGQKCYK